MHFPDLYLSGGFNLSPDEEIEMLKRSHGKFRCISAAFVIPENLHYTKREVEKMEINEKLKTTIMLDSGAASLHGLLKATGRRGKIASQRQELSVEDLQKEMYKRYITFVREKLKKKKISWYVTLDFKKNQPIIYAMQKKFAKDKLCPAPVFHGDSGVEWLKKYSDMGIKFMCLGSVQTRVTRRDQSKYFDIAFNAAEKLGIKFHGLGFSSPELFLQYPFKSIDTAAWTKTAAYGCVLIPLTGFAFTPIHISSKTASSMPHSLGKMPPSEKKRLADYMRKYGFDLKLSRDSSEERGMWNAFVYVNYHKMEPFANKTSAEKPKWESLL